MPSRKTRQDYLNLAEKRGFKFLFKGEPENSKIKYEWECKEGHIFEMKYNSIHNGQGCQPCYDNRRGQTLLYGIEKYHELAFKKEFKFIDKIIPTHTHNIYWWECDFKHKWRASYHNISSSDSGCPGCYGNQKKTIEDYHYLAKERGFIFLDPDIPKGNSGFGNWKCNNNHLISLSYHSLDQGVKCPECFVFRKNIEDYHTLAKERGFEFVDEIIPENVNCTGNWKCDNNHIWLVRYSDIIQGSGCPHCCQHKSEKMCRDIMEELLDIKFPKVRPNFLQRLELDGYNEDEKIAFEYNGIQHDVYTLHYHRNGPDDLVKQQERDQKKYRLCKENDIKLVIIPHKYSFKTPKKLREYIITELENLDLIIHIEEE